MKNSVRKQIFNIAFVVALIIFTTVTLVISSDELNYDSLSAFFSACNYWYIAIAFIFFLLLHCYWAGRLTCKLSLIFMRTLIVLVRVVFQVIGKFQKEQILLPISGEPRKIILLMRCV